MRVARGGSPRVAIPRSASRFIGIVGVSLEGALVDGSAVFPALFVTVSRR
jgi:hypothetical protein